MRQHYRITYTTTDAKGRADFVRDVAADGPMMAIQQAEWEYLRSRSRLLLFLAAGAAKTAPLSVSESDVQIGSRKWMAMLAMGWRERWISHNRTTVCGLHGLCSPPAIARFIIPVIVDSINAVFWRRRLAHVLQERQEAGSPPLADSNAAPAPILEAAAVGVVAAPVHSLPASINTGSRIAVSQPGLRDAAHIDLKAPTALRRATTQMLGSNDLFSSAVALAPPTDRARGKRLLNHEQASDPKTGKVNLGGHRDNSSVSRRRVFQHRSGFLVCGIISHA